MKKILCVFLAILTLSFCFVLNVSAEGVELADYDYKNYDFYKLDLSFMNENYVEKEKVFEFVNIFGINLTTENILNPYFNVNNLVYKTSYIRFETQVPSYVFNDNNTYIREIRIYPDENEEGSFYVKFYLKWGRSGSMGSITLHSYIDYKGDLLYFTIIGGDDFIFSNGYILIPKEPISNEGSTYSDIAQYKLNDSNNEYEFMKPSQFVKALSKLGKITYVEPEEMAMRANVTYSLPYVINYVKIVVNSIFTPAGALYSLAPVAIISISISVLLLGAYIIKRFSWGI